MKVAKETADEEARLATLEEIRAVYSPADSHLDQITEMTRQALDAPVALVSLVAHDRQWFKANRGLPASETPRDISFCGHAIQQDEVFLVEDATDHPWFVDNPLVAEAPGIRAYAGQPLRVHGRHVGTLCVIDYRARKFDRLALARLQAAAKEVESLLESPALSRSQQALLNELDEGQRRDLLDPVTQLWNRAGAEQVLLREFEVAGREGGALTVLLIAFDGLCEVAEQKGEGQVDAMLAEYAYRLRQLSHPVSLVARYANDTLLVAFPHEDDATSLAQAQSLVEGLSAGDSVSIEGVEAPEIRAAGMTAYSPRRLGVGELLVRAEGALAKVRLQPAGTVLIQDRRQAPRE